MRFRKFLSTAAAVMAVTVASASLPASAQSIRATSGPIHQLRVYEMVERNQPAFDARFRNHALRIMRRHGFDMVASWYTDDGAEFAYLLQWPDRDAMRRGWAAFMADEEWKRIKRESTRDLDGPIMGEILQDRVLVPADWSPNRTLPVGTASRGE
jgi:heme-degrading monooxygenase HmoA